MPRTYTICGHQQRSAIEKALAAREALLAKYPDLLRRRLAQKSQLVTGHGFH